MSSMINLQAKPVANGGTHKVHINLNSNNIVNLGSAEECANQQKNAEVESRGTVQARGTSNHVTVFCPQSHPKTASNQPRETLNQQKKRKATVKTQTLLKNKR